MLGLYAALLANSPPHDIPLRLVSDLASGIEEHVHVLAGQAASGRQAYGLRASELCGPVPIFVEATGLVC